MSAVSLSGPEVGKSSGQLQARGAALQQLTGGVRTAHAGCQAYLASRRVFSAMRSQRTALLGASITSVSRLHAIIS